METETCMHSQQKLSFNLANQQAVFTRDPAAIGRQLKRPSAPIMNRSKFIPPTPVFNAPANFKSNVKEVEIKMSMPLKRFIPPMANNA